MEFKDYYKILGAPRTATEKEIKAAYRKLARKFHPDVNPGNAKAEARFKEINEANEVLSDPEKRKRYDALGADWNSQRPPAGWPGGAWPGAGRGGRRVHVSEEDLGGFSEFFRTFFGGGFGGPGAGGPGPGRGGGFSTGGGFEEVFSQAAQQQRQESPAHPVELTLEEAARGTTRTLRLDLGGGSQQEIEVKIPAGIKEGARVRVPGRGERGDLYLSARIVPHPRFERQDDDLRTTVSVPLTTAVLGGEVEVPTLDGRVSIKVPPATPAGRAFRIRGQGMPRKDGQRGDLIASLSLELPKALGDRERELFEELRKLGV